MRAAPNPVLIACAHGTRDPAGRRAVERLVAALGEGADVIAAYVDVQRPTPQEALAAAGGRPAVLLPLLLSAGYHVEVDLARAARQAGGACVVADPLGPHPLLVPPLVASLAASPTAHLTTALRAATGPAGRPGAAAGTPPAPPDAPLAPSDDDIRLVAAGSSRPTGGRDVAAMAGLLAADLGRPVRPAYLSAADPLLRDVVAADRSAGRRTIAVSYLLAPGFFQRRLAAAGASAHTTALLHPDAEPPAQLVELARLRYGDAARRLSRAATPRRRRPPAATPAPSAPRSAPCLSISA